jgi:hypothetical protein
VLSPQVDSQCATRTAPQGGLSGGHSQIGRERLARGRTASTQVRQRASQPDAANRRTAADYERFHGGILGVFRPVGWPAWDVGLPVCAGFARDFGGFGSLGELFLVRFRIGCLGVLAAMKPDYEDLTPDSRVGSRMEPKIAPYRAERGGTDGFVTPNSRILPDLAISRYIRFRR